MPATEAAERRFLPKGASWTIFKLALGAALLGYIFFRINFHAVAAVAAAARPGLLALACMTLCCNPVFGGLRWWCVVRGMGQKAQPGILIGLFWIGILVGQALPNPIGDTVRVSVAVRRGLSLGLALRSAVLERVFMVLALLALIVTTSPLLHARVAAAPIWAAWVLLAVGLGVLVLLLVADRATSSLRRIHLLGMLVQISAEFRSLAASGWAIGVVATALLGNLNLVLCAAILGAALSLPLTASDYLAVMPLATLAMVLPISVGGWGIREGVLVALLGAIGIPAATALAFSLMFGVAAAVASLPAVAIWSFGRSPARGTQQSHLP